MAIRCPSSMRRYLYPVQRTDYDPWGNVTRDTLQPGFRPIPFGCAGGLYDRDTKLLRFGGGGVAAEDWVACSTG
jgi:hypothetical protein